MRRLLLALLLISSSVRADGPGRVIDTSPGVVFGGLAQSAPLPMVAVGTNVAAYSFDEGSTWALGTIPAGAWVSAVFGNGRYVAFSSSGANSIAYSLDGITWAAATAPALGYVRGAFGAGLFVGIASATTTAVSSTDGITWASNTIVSRTYSDVVRGADKFVTVNNPNVSRSTDGITWVENATTIGTRTSVGYGPDVGRYCALGASSAVVQYSTDGISWTSGTFPSNGTYREIVWNGSIFVGVAQSGTTRAVTSSDGITWSTQTIDALAWISVTWTGTKFVALDASGNIATSPDGVTWSTLGDLLAGTGWVRLAYPKIKNTP